MVYLCAKVKILLQKNSIPWITQFCISKTYFWISNFLAYDFRIWNVWYWIDKLQKLFSTCNTSMTNFWWTPAGASSGTMESSIIALVMTSKTLSISSWVLPYHVFCFFEARLNAFLTGNKSIVCLCLCVQWFVKFASFAYKSIMWFNVFYILFIFLNNIGNNRFKYFFYLFFYTTKFFMARLWAK